MNKDELFCLSKAKLYLSIYKNYDKTITLNTAL